MNPLPAPKVPGKTEFERFDNAVRQALVRAPPGKDPLFRGGRDPTGGKATAAGLGFGRNGGTAIGSSITLQNE